MKNFFCFGAFALLLQSCVLHPRYQPPGVEVPDQWRFAPDAQEETLRVEGAQHASFHPIDINSEWWDQFKDPSLTALIDEALAYNQDIKVAIWRVAEYYARLGVVSSQFYPQIYGNGAASKQEVSLGGVEPAAPVNRITDLFNLNVALSYEIDIWGKIYSATESARAELLAQVNVRRAVVLGIVTSVASSYVQLREYDQELKIAVDTRKSYEESYRLAKLRYDEGITSELAVKQAESLIALAEAQVVRLGRLIGEEENRLSVLVGRSPAEIERGLAITDWPEPFGVPQGLPSALLFQRPDILTAEQELIAANARIGIARADYFPAISMTGLFGYESLELKNLFKSTARTWSYGGNLLQAIFTGGLISSLVAQAEAVKWGAYYTYQQVVLNAFKEVENALIFYRKSKELFLVESNRVEILKESLHLANLQYENGQTDYLNVLDAERNLFDAQLDLATAQGDIFLALIDIYKSLAGGWVAEADCQALSAASVSEEW